MISFANPEQHPDGVGARLIHPTVCPDRLAQVGRGPVHAVRPPRLAVEHLRRRQDHDAAVERGRHRLLHGAQALRVRQRPAGRVPGPIRHFVFLGLVSVALTYILITK